MIRDLMFKDRLIDIETLKVESRLKKFWLKFSDDDNSLTEGFYEYSGWIKYISVQKRVWRKNLKDRDWASLKNYISTSKQWI